MKKPDPVLRISLRELADVTAIPLRTIQRWCDDGKLASHKLFGRWYIDVHDLLTSSVLSPFATDLAKSFAMQKARTRQRRSDSKRERERSSRAARPERQLWSGARVRAAKAGLEFSLRESDIVIPETCPVLGIPIVVGGDCRDNSPSLDRIDNAKGYTPENVAVISWRANTLKMHGSAEEHERIATWMRSRGL